VELVEPQLQFDDGEVLLRMPGIGGTGVVTVSQILQMAAHLDGKFAAGLEQTGLAQKGGPVVSDVRIAKQPVRGSLRASRATADVLIGFDLLGAAEASNLATARPGHTVAVVNTSLVPTAAMVMNRVALPGSAEDSITRIAEATRAKDNVYLDAQRLSEELFDDHMPTNMLLIGAAYQNGCIPISADAIEEAIRLNGAAVDKTLTAFRWGRAAVIGSAMIFAAVTTAVSAVVQVDAASRALARSITTDGDLQQVLATRVADLTGFQNEALALRYADEVTRVVSIARSRVDDDAAHRVGTAYARNLHKLLAYKDEYEVARLHLDPVEKARRDAEFGPDADVSVLLHPPILRAMGMKQKIRLRGRTSEVTFRALRAAKTVRNTPLDVFGHAKVRRVERELIAEYQQLVRSSLDRLSAETLDTVLELVELPDMIRGYEEIKLANVERYRERARALSAELSAVAEGR
jgi:indolepyruvate ferredoxin oxidoreductase